MGMKLKLPNARRQKKENLRLKHTAIALAHPILMSNLTQEVHLSYSTHWTTFIKAFQDYFTLRPGSIHSTSLAFEIIRWIRTMLTELTVIP